MYSEVTGKMKECVLQMYNGENGQPYLSDPLSIF